MPEQDPRGFFDALTYASPGNASAGLSDGSVGSTFGNLTILGVGLVRR